MVGVPGFMAIDTKAAAVIFSVADPLTVPALMVIVVDPGSRVVASPCDPGESLMVATLASDEVQ